MLHHSPTQTCLYKRLTDTKDLKLHQDLINRSKWRSRVEMTGHRVDHLYSDQVQPAHRTTTKPMRVAVSRGGQVNLQVCSRILTWGGGSSEKCSGLLSGCRYFSSAACWASLTDGRWQQLGSARPDRLQLHPRLLQAPRLRGSSGGSELFKTPERQLSAGSGPSAGALLPFHCTCELVQDRLSDGGQPRLHSLLFTAEGPRLQEGRKGGRKSARRDGKCSPSRAERCFQHSLNTTVPCVHSPRDHLLVFGVWLQQT